MDRRDLINLRKIAQAESDKASAALLSTRKEESELRAELAELSRLRAEALRWASNNPDSRHLGVDSQWTGFLGQRQRDLNLHLVRNLATQGPQRESLRRAIARQEVMQTLETRARQAQERLQRKKATDALNDLALVAQNYPKQGS